jgi:hypothetical protein
VSKVCEVPERQVCRHPKPIRDSLKRTAYFRHLLVSELVAAPAGVLKERIFHQVAQSLSCRDVAYGRQGAGTQIGEQRSIEHLDRREATVDLGCGILVYYEEVSRAHSHSVGHPLACMARNDPSFEDGAASSAG